MRSLPHVLSCRLNMVILLSNPTIFVSLVRYPRAPGRTRRLEVMVAVCARGMSVNWGPSIVVRFACMVGEWIRSMYVGKPCGQFDHMYMNNTSTLKLEILWDILNFGKVWMLLATTISAAGVGGVSFTVSPRVNWRQSCFPSTNLPLCQTQQSR